MAPVRLVIARCTVDYAGRLSAISRRLRLLIGEGRRLRPRALDGGSYKPLNWMSPPCRLTEEPGRWV